MTLVDLFLLENHNFTIAPANTTQHLVTFQGLDPFQNYRASLSVGTPELVDQVQLGPTLELNIPANQVLGVITGLQKEVSNLTSELVGQRKTVLQLTSEIADLRRNVSNLSEALKELLTTPTNSGTVSTEEATTVDVAVSTEDAVSTEKVDAMSTEEAPTVNATEEAAVGSPHSCSCGPHKECTANGTCKCAKGYSSDEKDECVCSVCHENEWCPEDCDCQGSFNRNKTTGFCVSKCCMVLRRAEPHPLMPWAIWGGGPSHTHSI